MSTGPVVESGGMLSSPDSVPVLRVTYLHPLPQHTLNLLSKCSSPASSTDHCQQAWPPQCFLEFLPPACYPGIYFLLFSTTFRKCIQASRGKCRHFPDPSSQGSPVCCSFGNYIDFVVGVFFAQSVCLVPAVQNPVGSSHLTLTPTDFHPLLLTASLLAPKAQ